MGAVVFIWLPHAARVAAGTMVNASRITSYNVCYTKLLREMGEDSVTGNYFFKRDHTHTSAKGAILASSFIVDGLRNAEECNLKEYLLENPKINFPIKKKVYIIGDSTVANGNDEIVGRNNFV